MPSFKTIAAIGLLGAGAAVGAKWGWNNAATDPTVETSSDRMAYAGSSAVAGIFGVAGVAGGAYAIKATGAGPHIMGAAGWAGRKGLAGFKGTMSSIPKGASRWSKMPGVLKGPMKALGLVGLGIGALGVAMTMSSNTSADAYGSPDGSGGTQYSDQPSVRDRANMMKASGDMVFGLHNSRHR